MDPEEQAAKYAWQARRFLWLTNHIMRLGQTGSFVDDMQVEREQLRRTVPAQYIEDAIKEGVGVNEKGIFHLETRIFYNGDESVSDQYWCSTPPAMRQLAAKVGEEWKRKEEERKKNKAAALLQAAGWVWFLRQEERKRKRESE